MSGRLKGLMRVTTLFDRCSGVWLSASALAETAIHRLEGLTMGAVRCNRLWCVKWLGLCNSIQ